MKALRFIGSLLPSRAVRFLQELGHACSRISQEYHEIALQQAGKKQSYRAVVWVYPLQVRDRDRFREAFTKAAGGPLGEGPSAWVPFRNGCLFASVETPSAEHASAMLLTLVRDAAKDCGLTFDEVRTECVLEVAA